MIVEPNYRKATTGFSNEFQVGRLNGRSVSALAAVASIDYGQEPNAFYRNRFKRLIDVVLVVLAAPVVVPVLLIAAVFIAMDGSSPIYWSERVGRHGRVFKMMKLRTMVHDADSRLEAYLKQNPKAAHEWETTQKLKNDPRITPLGRLLRKTSVDELPQLWNVLIGEMSLVGPRPFMPSQTSLYPGRSYYELLPGLTGPWQVSERNESEFIDRAIYDHQYYETVSLRTDVTLIIRTVSVVFNATGY